MCVCGGGSQRCQISYSHIHRQRNHDGFRYPSLGLLRKQCARLTTPEPSLQPAHSHVPTMLSTCYPSQILPSALCVLWEYRDCSLSPFESGCPYHCALLTFTSVLVSRHPRSFFVVSCFIPSVRVPLPPPHPDIFFVSLRNQVPNISGVRRTSVSSLRFTISRFSSSSSRLALIASMCTHGDDGKVFVRAPSGVGSFLAFHL